MGIEPISNQGWLILNRSTQFREIFLKNKHTGTSYQSPNHRYKEIKEM